MIITEQINPHRSFPDIKRTPVTSSFMSKWYNFDFAEEIIELPGQNH